MDSHKALSIGLVGPLPPPSGGMANQTLQLDKLLREEGVSTRLIQVNKPYSPAWVGRIKVLRALLRLLSYVFELWISCREVQLLHVMANSGWSWHLFAAPAVWVARLRGIPVIINYRGGEAQTFFKRSYRWVAPTLKRVRYVVVPSNFLQQVFAERGVDTSVIPNIINRGRFFPAGEQYPARSPRLVVARNLEPIYDIATAIRAFNYVLERYPEAELYIAGEGPDRTELESLIRDLRVGDSVVFTGRVDNEHMGDLYRSADVMLNPSLADNMPNSVLEALASGVLVVSTDVGGVPFLVTNEETALLVRPSDPIAMAEATIRLLDDGDLRERLCTAGHELVGQYDWSTVKARWFDVYADALGPQ